MNRATRRAAIKQLPRHLRGGVPVISVTPEHWLQYFARYQPGTIVTIPGWRRRADGHGVEKCEPGEETPLRLELRRPNERLQGMPA